MKVVSVKLVFCGSVKTVCLTWDFERHSEVNLHDWDVLHSRGFLVHLHRGRIHLKHDVHLPHIVSVYISYTSLTTFIRYTATMTLTSQVLNKLARDVILCMMKKYSLMTG